MLANALGERLAGMNDVDEIAGGAVDELHRAFGYYLCAVLRLRDDDFVEGVAVRGQSFERLGERRWSQPRDAGIVGRALRERRVVLCNDVSAEPAYAMTPETGTRAELTAPIWVGGRLWGAVDIEEEHVDAFDDDDARLVGTVAGQIGSALRAAFLHAELERAQVGTAEALAAAIRARDRQASTGGESVVSLCEAVGRRLGFAGDALRDLRLAAAVHGIGRIAVPDGILGKPGPLDPGERAIVERHPLAGERILAPIGFLAGVARLVRHEFERWDGSGYPDGLAGPAIPLGSRVLLACAAHRAMTSARPYRPAMSPAQARAELARGRDSQFDPAVVEALLAALDDPDGGVAVAD